MAKLALDEVVAQFSSALPYAIVPNGNGVGAGFPYGNNAAGAALGPATRGAELIRISDWTHYLSVAFGQGIHPAFDANVNTLYPMSVTSTGLRTTASSSVCSGQGQIRSVTGSITGLSGSSFAMTTQDGGVYQMNYGPCTQMSSNQQGHQLQIGDQVIAKGTFSTANNFSCHQVVALS